MWAGIKEVVIAHKDPNPTVRGAGIQALKDAGIEVSYGLLESQAASQMYPFLHWCENRRPLVCIKLAVDSNGSVDDRSEDAGRFTSEDCLDKVHELRRQCDAILVGVDTVIRDNPSLTVRRIQTNRQPLRIVIDPNQRIPKSSKLLNDGLETLVMAEEFRTLPALLNLLGDKEIQRLMVEGGPTTIGHFLDQGLVDQFYLVQSSQIHQEPVPSNIDSKRLLDSGLIHVSDEQWGDETVSVWNRQ
jgi:diaminohydroxyphosphoribosylaminopyrimidine deaminase/5-amino-6-(5-phosphoribosylamino)uracil reductase